MSRSVLFFDALHSHLPLIRALAARGFVPVVHSPLEAVLKEEGAPFYVLERFVPADVQARVQAECQRVAQGLQGALRSPEVARAFSSPLGEFLPVTGDGFFRQLLGLAANEMVVLETLEALLAQRPLSLIVMGCDNSPTERVVVDFARRRGIPTLQLAHAIYTRPLARIAAEHKLFSDYIAVFGQRAKDIMVEYGIEPERIFPTGAPGWDAFYSPDARMEKTEARRRLGLDAERPTLLYCSAYVDGSSAFFPAFTRRLTHLHRTLMEAARGLGSELQLVVRPHPNELARAGLPQEAVAWLDGAYLERLRGEGICDAHVVRTHKVESILAADAVLAVGSSSIIAEAMILDRPVIIAPWLEQEKLIYTEDDGVAVIRDVGELPGLIESLMSDRARREEMAQRQSAALGELNFGSDGRATERVAELAERLAAPEAPAEKAPKPALSRREAEEEGALKLIFAAHNFLPYGLGGTERYTKDLALEMRSRGHDVRVLYPRYVLDDPSQCSVREGHFEELPVAEVLTSKNAYGLIRNEALKPALRRYLKQDPPDVVHAQHLMGLGVSFVELLEELQIPLVFTANDFWFMCQQIHLVSPEGTVCSGPETMDKCVECVVSRMGGASEEQVPVFFQFMADRYYTQRRVMKGLELILCPSKFLMDAFLRYEFAGTNALHAPQGAKLFTPLERPTRDVPPVIFAYVGTVDYRKGTDLAVEAFNRLESEGAELRIHGNIADKDYFDRIMQAVGPGKTVTYHGEYTAQDLPSILAAVDVALVPSRGENYPFVIREILNARVPVVASDVAGIPEIIQDGRNGLIFKGNDSGDLASKMERLIRQPELIETLRGGIEPVKSIPEDADEIEVHYRRILDDRRAEVQQTAPEEKTETVSLAVLPSASQGQLSEQAQEEPSASVVIVTYNSASTIRTCLDTVLETSGPSSEVIVVDNASADETRSILAEYQGRITTILNDENLGFSRGCNQGIEASSGRYVVLLNPDTAVTPGWIERMQAHLKSDVGAVGPLSNCVAAAQSVGRFMPEGKDGDYAIEVLAELLASHNGGRSAEAKLLIGFCLMLPRRVLDEVGFLDEDLFLGNDDLELSWRLREAGYRLLIATDAFVYHEGQVSFRSDEESKTSVLIQESTDRLYEKLEAHYGQGSVPHPMDLWGIEWFTPSRASFLERPSESRPALTSIIILTLNELDHTKLCLASIEANTPEPYELIIVDNGSTDGTVEFLRDYAQGREDVRVVANGSNLGFAAGNNQGLALARGDAVLLLNNDTIVTPGWLGRMLDVFSRHERAGIVGPVSNYVSGPQLVPEASYRSRAEMESFATRWAEEHSGRSEPTLRVVGFCLLARRDVVDAIGGLDEQFGSGNFEDDDFCIRAARAGFEARIARDVFIHHTGSQTFKGAKIDFSEAMERNWGLFKAKWGIPLDTPMTGSYHLPPELPEDALRSVPLPELEESHASELEGRWWRELTEEERAPKVRIVSLREPLDGSEAQEALERFNGGLPTPHVWADGAFINRELERAEYLLLLAPDVIVTRGWLDTLLAVAEADESVAAVGPTSNEAPGPQRIKPDYQSIKKALRKFAARRARQHKTSWEEVPYLGGFCLLLKSRAVLQAGGLDEGLPLGDGLWSLFGRLQAEGCKLACALGAYVHHEELSDDEGARYDEMVSLQEAAVDVLDEAHQALERGDLESAAGLFEEAARSAPNVASIHWAFGSTLVALERMDEGIDALRRAAEIAPGEAVLQNQIGVALYQMGQPEEARQAFEAALAAAPEDVDTLLNLVELHRAKERYVEASEHLKRAQSLAPVDAGVLSALGSISVELGDVETARKALEHLEAVEPQHPEIQPLKEAIGVG